MANAGASADRRFDIVVFDLGGVLVQIVRSWAEAHERAGLPPHSILEDDAFHGERERLMHALEVGDVTPGEFAAGMAIASHGAYTADDAFNILLAWHIGEYPGVGHVIDAIDAAGLATGALSNTNMAHWQEVREASSETRFPTVRRLQYGHASHLLRLAKPNPAAFQAFERETGFAANRILFFDDRHENVEAAGLVGWHAEQIDPTGDTADQLESHLRAFDAID